MASLATHNNANNDNDDETGYEYSFQNSPPNLKPAFKHFADTTLRNIEERLERSIGDVDIENAVYHIGLLSRYLELKYPVTRKRRAKLSDLCLLLLFEFPIDLEQQTTVCKVVSSLIKNENLSTVGFELDWRPFYNLLRSTQCASRDGATQRDDNGTLSEHANALQQLIKRANVYFRQSSFAEILDEVLPFMNVTDIYYTRSISLLHCLLPFKQKWVPHELKHYALDLDIDDALQQQHHNDELPPPLLLFLLHHILHETVWMSSTPGKLIEILTRIIVYNREFVPSLQPFVPDMLHYLYLDAQLPINGSRCIIKKYSHLNKGAISGRGGAWNLSRLGVQNIVSLLVYLMDNGGDNDRIQLSFVDFFENASNYFYPDENRTTSTFTFQLTTLLTAFCAVYTQRYWKELRAYDNSKCAAYSHIGDELKRTVFSWHAQYDRTHPLYRELDDRFKLKPSLKLFTAMLPLIRWGIYCKSPISIYGGYAAITSLSTLFPQQTVQWAMNEITECLQAVTQSHRLSIGIGLLDAITPTLINRYLLPDVQVQFVEFLQQILFGIDPSLSKQCSLTMAYLHSIFTSIPIISAKDRKKNGHGDDDTEMKQSEFGYNYNDENGRLSTYAFEPFALSFCEKIIKYARDSSTALDSLKTSGSANDTSGIRNFVPRSNRVLLKQFKKCVYSFWFAISKSIYLQCREKVLSIIDEPQCGALGAIIVSGTIYPYPQLSLDLFLPKIIAKILYLKTHKKSRNAFNEQSMNKYQPDLFELRGSKEVLHFYLGLIEAVSIAAHSHIIQYIPVLSNIITICVNSPLPEIKKFAGPILQAVIVTLTRESPLEARAFSPDRWNEDGSWKHWRDWGQFTEIEMKRMLRNWRPDLKLKWFYPTQSEFDAMQQLINNVLSQPLAQINAFIRDSNEQLQQQQPAVKAEQLLEYIRVLYHMCYGLGHLGDFDIDKDAQLLPTVKEDNYFRLQQDDTMQHYFNYMPSKDISDKIYGQLNKLRNALKLPIFKEYENVSLRTALTRIAIRLYQKLAQYSDTSDCVIDATELPSPDRDDSNVEMSDSSFSNINLSEILPAIKRKMKTDQDDNDDSDLNDEENNQLLKSLSALKKSKLFPGVSKVMVWLNTFVNIIMNHDGVMWGVVSSFSIGARGLSLQRFELLNGHKYATRCVLVNEAHALSLKRLYFLFNHNSYTTDTRALIEELVKCSISEFENVRNQAIHALISGRSIYNFRSGIEWAFRFWLKILSDSKSEKSQLLGATKALKNNELMTQLILRTHQRHREFISVLLSSSIHREPAVQSAIYRIFFDYANSVQYHTVYLPSNLSKDEARQKEIESINANFQREHELLQQELVRIAKKDKKSDTDNESTTSSISADSDSFVKIPSTPDDPVVSSLSSLISNLDLASLNIDLSQIRFDINNVTPAALSQFLAKQGFNLPATMFDSLSRQQLQSIIDSSKLSKYIRTKVGDDEEDEKSRNEKHAVDVHWKYKLMATILLWLQLRPNTAPIDEVIEYMLKLIGNEIPSLNRVAISSLCVIVHSYLPLLHYKHVLKDPANYPVDHSFAWTYTGTANTNRRKLNITDLYNPLPLHMRPRAKLSALSASLLHEYLATNLDVVFKAFVDNHPNIIDASAPRQNRSSSETQLTNLVHLHSLWPYDGFDVPAGAWEDMHYLLTRDLLRCQWPNSNQDADVKNWKCDGNLWNLALDQLQVHAKNMKEKKYQFGAAEILAGILRAYHHFAAIEALPTGIDLDLLNEKLTQPLLKVIAQCPQESVDAWCSAIRCGSANSDANHMAWFIEPILRSFANNLQIVHSVQVDDEKQKEKNAQLNSKEYISADKQVRAMRYVTEILISYGCRGENIWRFVLTALTKPENQIDFKQLATTHANAFGVKEVDYAVFDCFFANTFQSVRGDIGILLGITTRCLRKAPSPLMAVYDCTSTDAQFVSLLKVIETQFVQLWNAHIEEQMAKQQQQTTTKSNKNDRHTKKFNRFLQTLCYWLLQCYNNSNVVVYQTLFTRLLPLVLYGAHREDAKTMETVKMTSDVMSWTCFHASQVSRIVTALLDTNRTPKLINNAQWQIRKGVLQFLLRFIARNAMLLNDTCLQHRERIVEYLIEHALQDKQLEVRVQARDVLTALVQCSTLKQAQHIKVLSQRFEKLARTKLSKRSYDSVDTRFDHQLSLKLRKKHCGVLGLSSLILSVPYTVPEWLPEVLSFVAVLDRQRAPIGMTAKQTVAEFKRTHQDEWHIFKQQFSADQLCNIQDASSTSYFV